MSFPVCLTAYGHCTTQSRLAIREKCSSSSRVVAKIKVDVSTILVRNVANRIPVNGAQIVDADFHTLLLHWITVQVCIDGKLIACVACWTSSLARTCAELFLAKGGGVSRSRLSTCVRSRGTVRRPVLIARSILGEGGSHRLSCSKRQCRREVEDLREHDEETFGVEKLGLANPSMLKRRELDADDNHNYIANLHCLNFLQIVPLESLS